MQPRQRGLTMPFNKPLRPDSYVQQTLLRYTGSEHTEFKRHVLLTNFSDYVERFKALGDHVHHSQTWESVHNDDLDCSMVSFGIGSPAAAMVMHCLGYLDQVDAVIMLGLAGGLAEEMQIGDIVLPTASIRDEGASQHYLHSNTPRFPISRFSTSSSRRPWRWGSRPVPGSSRPRTTVCGSSTRTLPTS